MLPASGRLPIDTVVWPAFELETGLVGSAGPKSATKLASVGRKAELASDTWKPAFSATDRRASRLTVPVGVGKVGKFAWLVTLPCSAMALSVDGSKPGTDAPATRVTASPLPVTSRVISPTACML